jgi:hypothetical protein
MFKRWSRSIEREVIKETRRADKYPVLDVFSEGDHAEQFPVMAIPSLDFNHYDRVAMH